MNIEEKIYAALCENTVEMPYTQGFSASDISSFLMKIDPQTGYIKMPHATTIRKYCNKLIDRGLIKKIEWRPVLYRINTPHEIAAKKCQK